MTTAVAALPIPKALPINRTFGRHKLTGWLGWRRIDGVWNQVVVNRWHIVLDAEMPVYVASIELLPEPRVANADVLRTAALMPVRYYRPAL